MGVTACHEDMTGSLVAAAILGLALTACLWWVYFGTATTTGPNAPSPRRPQRPGLALSAYFFAHIPMLLGVVAMAAGVLLTIGHAARPHPVGQAIALSGGVALPGRAMPWFRAALAGSGDHGPQLGAAVFALAAAALGATVAVEAQLALLLAALVLMLAGERYAAWR